MAEAMRRRVDWEEALDIDYGYLGVFENTGDELILTFALDLNEKGALRDQPRPRAKAEFLRDSLWDFFKHMGRPNSLVEYYHLDGEALREEMVKDEFQEGRLTNLWPVQETFKKWDI